MQMYQNGSEEAFKVLYSRSLQQIYNYFLGKTRQVAAAEELTQEVFFKLHRSKHLFNGQHPFIHWIFVIARNSWLDFLRKNKKLQIDYSIELDHLADKGESNSLSDLEKQQDQTALQFSLGNLPETQKRSLQLRYLDEKSYAEIAEILQTSESNVRQLVSRGLAKLKIIRKQESSS